jgi:serine/threonine protein kinase
MGGMGEDNADVNRDVNDAMNGVDGASGPPAAPRDGGTLNMGAQEEPARGAPAEPQDAAPWYATSANEPPAPPVPPMPPMPPQPPAVAEAAEEADRAEEGPEPVPSAHTAPEPGTVILTAREPQDAAPPEAPPATTPSPGLPSEPGTVILAAREPQDQAPDAAGPGPGTLDMGQREPQDESAGPDRDAEPSDEVPRPPAPPEADRAEEGPEPVRWQPLAAEPGTVPLAAREPQDETPPPTGSPWAGAPADDDDGEASLGGDAPLVGLAGADDDSTDDGEDESLGGEAPLVRLPESSPESSPAESSPAESSGEGAPDWSADQTGRLLAGRYRLTDAVGRGGMGTVWRAHDEMLGRFVAVKELRLPSGVDDHERGRLITRTLREAKAIASIRNQGVVTVFDVVDEGSRPWIVMELIEGRSLADIIRSEGPMPPPRVAEIGLAVLDVLRAAHGAGILHRDVKPSNVLVAHEDGRVVLTDFGIAKVEGDPSITTTGMLVGAPSYISPERARGEVLGPPADLWSLGALMYCCVEGMPPYDEGSAIATLAAVMHDPVPPPRQAGVLTEVITGLLNKAPTQRLDEARARELLHAALERPAPPTPPPPPIAPMASPEQEPPRPTGVPGESSTMVMGARSPDPSPAPSPAQYPLGSPPLAPHPTMPPTHPRPSAAPPPQSAGGGPDGSATRRRTLIIVGVAVVLLALIGAALATTLGGDSEGGQEGESEGQDAGASGGSGDTGQSPEETTDPTQDPTDEPTEEPTDPTEEPSDDGGPPGTVPSNDPDATLPDDPSGVSAHTEEDLRFSMSLPSGWERTGTAEGGSGAVYGAPDGGPESVQVDFNGSPADSALSAWRSLEPAVADDSADYEFVSIAPVQWRDYPTAADWEFERTEDGERVHALNRGVRVDDDQGYAITITCAAEEWDEAACQSLRDTVFGTFQPLD